MSSRESNRRGRRLAGRILLTLAVVGSIAGFTMAGTYATWTSAVNENNQILSGTVAITLGSTGAQTNRLNINASGIAPGDTIKRSVDLTNASGNIDLASITLTTAASPSSALDTDAINGLQMQIDRCSQAWTESGSSPAFSYACGGTTAAVFASARVIQTSAALSNLTATTNNNTDHLLITLTLPAGATTAVQGANSTITYTFTGTQRAASAH